MADVLQTLRQAGFKGPALKTAWAIVQRESKGNPRAFNPNPATKDLSYGLFQINMRDDLGPSRRKQYGLASNDALYDPLTNAKVAYRLSKGGTDWGHWGVGPNAYRQTAPLDFSGFPGEGAAAPVAPPAATPSRAKIAPAPKVKLAQLNALARQHGFKNFRQAFGFDDDGEINKLLAQSGTRLPTVRTLQGGIPVVNNTDGRLPRTVAKVLDIADDYLGTPYVWGAKGPAAFDCSGLIQFVYKKVGVDPGGYTIAQWRNGQAVDKQSELKPGDAVFFRWGKHPETGEEGPQHVGLYMGNGLYLQSPRSGDVVKVSRLSDRDDFAGGRRYI